MKCLYCPAVQLRKHGVSEKGKQRYRCMACYRTFMATPDVRRLAPDTLDFAYSLRGQGMSLRIIAKQLGVAHTTLAAKLKKPRVDSAA